MKVGPPSFSSTQSQSMGRFLPKLEAGTPRSSKPADRGHGLIGRHGRGEAGIVDTAISPPGVADRSAVLDFSDTARAIIDLVSQRRSRVRPGRRNVGKACSTPVTGSEGGPGVFPQDRIWAWPM